MNQDLNKYRLNVTRRKFLTGAGLGLGTIGLGSLLAPGFLKGSGADEQSLAIGIPHFAPKAKRVIYLFQNGAPSQLESFDYKPMLNIL